jgi:hypothetical protein
MISRCIILAGLITALSMNSGCGITMSVLEKNWGDSYESQKISQIAHPNASENLDPVVGFDGVAAEINTEKYREGFKGQKGGDVYDLQLGNISGIGKSK